MTGKIFLQVEKNITQPGIAEIVNFRVDRGEIELTQVGPGHAVKHAATTLHMPPDVDIVNLSPADRQNKEY